MAPPARGPNGMPTPRPAVLLLATLLLAGCDADRGALPLPRNGDAVVGSVRTIRLDEPATAIDVARRHSVGIHELRASNAKVPGIRSGKIPAGTELRLPTQFILPDAPRRGIVINIAERRLYYFPGDADDEPRTVMAFPAAVGREEWETPTGETHVAERIVDPPWYPPASIREAQADEGRALPAKVPPGPDNPLGKYALRLGWNKHLIHGTNQPRSIGKRVSHGCVRLYPEDMEQLFGDVREGTPVKLVDEAVKLGSREGALYLEAHASDSDAAAEARERVPARISAWARKHPERRIDWEAVQRALDASRGLPVRISAS
jgi:L,D-transpeptidase ErfK/SrfK